jgi:hypothetical protein
VVVDSCVQHRTKRNPILDYLDRIGVNISSSVPLVVATHADADDIADVSDMFAVPYPLFVWWILSIAMSAEELLRLFASDELVPGDGRCSRMAQGSTGAGGRFAAVISSDERPAKPRRTARTDSFGTRTDRGPGGAVEAVTMRRCPLARPSFRG